MGSRDPRRRARRGSGGGGRLTGPAADASARTPPEPGDRRSAARSILVTNDDGISAPGLATLAQAAVEAGLDVLVVAPARDYSGASAAIGPTFATEGIEVAETGIEGLDVPAYALAGPPALAVLAARLGAFGEPPQLVASGINPGPNTGRAVMHSGTVGAALTAANFGVSGLAVSIETGESINWSTAGAVARAAIGWLRTAPRRTVLNLNVPNRPLAQVAGVRWAPLAAFGTVRAAIGEYRDGRIELEFRDTEHELEPGTDTAVVLDGWVSVTALTGVRAANEVDAPSAISTALEELRSPPAGAKR